MTNRQHMTDYLRGIAALMVCFCHFRHALPHAWQPSVYTVGTLGVQIFFVISGFIIPYSLAKADYRISALPRFLVKRFVRLHPPLLAALVVTFVLSHAAAAYKHTGSSFDLATFWQTAIYRGIPDENPVVWTLIVEAKYYLFIGLLYPVLFSRDARVRVFSFGLCALAVAAASISAPHPVTTVTLDLASPAPGPFSDLKYLPFFMMGFAACQYAIRLVSAREAIALAFVAALCAWNGSTMPQIAIGLVAALLVNVRCGPAWKSGLFFGGISYSLYLLHFPVGVKLLNLMLPWTREPWSILLLPVALAASVVTAWVLWRYVETPSAQWSQKIKLAPPKTVQEAVT